jgi:hypothetical protein
LAASPPTPAPNNMSPMRNRYALSISLAPWLGGRGPVRVAPAADVAGCLEHHALHRGIRHSRSRVVRGLQTRCFVTTACAWRVVRPHCLRTSLSVPPRPCSSFLKPLIFFAASILACLAWVPGAIDVTRSKVLVPSGGVAKPELASAATFDGLAHPARLSKSSPRASINGRKYQQPQTGQ